MYQRVVFGNVTNDANKNLADMNGRELALILPVILFIVWIGVYPGTFLDLSSAKAKEIITSVTQPGATVLSGVTQPRPAGSP
jgi:NADH-quinone oxidoreductase subunit M